MASCPHDEQPCSESALLLVVCSDRHRGACQTTLPCELTCVEVKQRDRVSPCLFASNASRLLCEYEWIATRLRAGTSSFVFVWIFLGGEMCCLSVHVDTSDSICVCVCVQLVVFCVFYMCVRGIKPYLFTERVCLANTSWLPCSWQTDRQLQFVYCFRTLEIVGTWKRLGPACVWFMRRVLFHIDHKR